MAQLPTHSEYTLQQRKQMGCFSLTELGKPLQKKNVFFPARVPKGI